MHSMSERPVRHRRAIRAALARLALGAAATALGSAVPASAETGERDALTEAVTAQQLEANQKICKRVRPTGSHIKQRVCLRRKEWAAIEEETQRILRDASNTTGSLGETPAQ